jgi:autoinducer 2-degrading protein
MDSATTNIIAVVAKGRIRPGQEETAHQLIREMSAAVRQHEPSNLLYVAHTDPTDATSFLIYEQYADQQALEAHRASANYQEIIVGKMNPLLVERTVSFYQLLS